MEEIHQVCTLVHSAVGLVTLACKQVVRIVSFAVRYDGIVQGIKVFGI